MRDEFELDGQTLNEDELAEMDEDTEEEATEEVEDEEEL